MITKKDNVFVLKTNDTAYLFCVNASGHLEHLHYGRSIDCPPEALPALTQKMSSLPSATIAYSASCPCLSMELMRAEISTTGKGDCGEPFIEAVFPDGSRTLDFLYKSAVISDSKPVPDGLPGAIDPETECSSLIVTLADRYHPWLILELTYTVYESCNVIVKSAKISNHGSSAVFIDRLLSSQIDFEDSDFIMTNFHGSWTSEMNTASTVCAGKTVISESRTGFSSNRANPFVMLSRPDATEQSGEVYGSNLIYSGSHRECAQSGELSRLRFSTGIQPEGFHWVLAPQTSLQAPEAVISFSDAGFEGLSHNYHRFITQYILRGIWKDRIHPVLLNSWEACYFDFNEEKILRLGTKAKELGIDLLVLDDGWFGRRNDTRSSMGDWYCNKEKLPNGISGLSAKIHEMGLQFGLWFEPEAISIDSDLYRAHPDWALSIPGQENSPGRNELLIDMCNPDVVEYLFTALSDILSQGVDYVKWDMNRNISDHFSRYLSSDQQGEVDYRQIRGLYTLLHRLTQRFPDVLFESCASGGNRADLGMLCYMPQFWGSDNSDAVSRIRIQTGYSYGYPLSVIGCHVSDVPNHQTMRDTSIEARYEVAAFGQLGYELDITKMDDFDCDAIKKQITHYKMLQKRLHDPVLYRLKAGSEMPGISSCMAMNGTGSGNYGLYSLMEVSSDKRFASVMTLQEVKRTGVPAYVLRTRGLSDDTMYQFDGRNVLMKIPPMKGRMFSSKETSPASHMIMPREPEHYTVPGSLMNNSGIRLKSDFIGHNLDDETRFYPDGGTRWYDISAVDRVLNVYC